MRDDHRQEEKNTEVINDVARDRGEPGVCIRKTRERDSQPCQLPKVVKEDLER